MLPPFIDSHPSLSFGNRQISIVIIAQHIAGSEAATANRAPLLLLIMQFITYYHSLAYHATHTGDRMGALTAPICVSMKWSGAKGENKIKRGSSSKVG